MSPFEIRISSIILVSLTFPAFGIACLIQTNGVFLYGVFLY